MADGLETAVMCKRTSSEYTLPYKSASGMRPRTTILTSMHDESESQKKDRRLDENVYIYREGIVPPSRQMFYQVSLPTQKLYLIFHIHVVIVMH